MKKSELLNILKNEGIYYLHHKLLFSRAAIVHYHGITAIVIDDEQIFSEVEEITAIIQELGHYFANAYYKSNSSFDFIENMEYKADIMTWFKFFPYSKIKYLRTIGIITATDTASYFNVEPSYMARCLNFYYKFSFGFEADDLLF